jgi:hypothetical protein
LENEHDHDDGDGGGGGGGDDPNFGSEDVTRIESQLGVVRSDGRVFNEIAAALDASTAALGRIEDALGRISPARRPQFVRSVILKLGRLGDCAYGLRHVFLEMTRADEDATKETK